MNILPVVAVVQGGGGIRKKGFGYALLSVCMYICICLYIYDMIGI